MTPYADDEFEELVDFNPNSQNNNMTKEDFWVHVKSAVLTFGATFLVVVSMGILEDSFSWNKASIIALGFSAIIAGVRGIAKLILIWFGAKM